MNQIRQTHHPTGSCLKRLSILSIHRSKSNKRQFRIFRNNSRFLCTSEYLYEMQLLTFICHINDLIWMIKLFSLYQSCKICCIIKCRSI